MVTMGISLLKPRLNLFLSLPPFLRLFFSVRVTIKKAAGAAFSSESINNVKNLYLRSLAPISENKTLFNSRFIVVIIIVFLSYIKNHICANIVHFWFFFNTAGNSNKLYMFNHVVHFDLKLWFEKLIKLTCTTKRADFD